MDGVTTSSTRKGNQYEQYHCAECDTNGIGGYEHSFYCNKCGNSRSWSICYGCLNSCGYELGEVNGVCTRQVYGNCGTCKGNKTVPVTSPCDHELTYFHWWCTSHSLSNDVNYHD